MCRSQDTHPLTFAAGTGLTKNKHVPECSFLFGQTSTNKSSKLPKCPENEAINGPWAYIHMVLQLKHILVLGGRGSCFSKALIEATKFIKRFLLGCRKVIGINFNYSRHD